MDSVQSTRRRAERIVRSNVPNHALSVHIQGWLKKNWVFVASSLLTLNLFGVILAFTETRARVYQVFPWIEASSALWSSTGAQWSLALLFSILYSTNLSFYQKVNEVVWFSFRSTIGRPTSWILAKVGNSLIYTIEGILGIVLVPVFFVEKFVDCFHFVFGSEPLRGILLFAFWCLNPAWPFTIPRFVVETLRDGLQLAPLNFWNLFTIRNIILSIFNILVWTIVIIPRRIPSHIFKYVACVLLAELLISADFVTSTGLELYLSFSPATAYSLFVMLAFFKFGKVIMASFSYYVVYKPFPAARKPTFTASDVTVIIPTVGSLDLEFRQCIESVLACRPARIIIVTVNTQTLNRLAMVVGISRTITDDLGHPPSKIMCIAVTEANKRIQVMTAVRLVKTPITLLASDNVFWPTSFLHSSLAPFEDPQMGIVGTVKRVNRERLGPYYSSSDIRNFIACLYLERHNFEVTASHGIDGGVFVISGRAQLLRTSIIQDDKFVRAFLGDYWQGPFPKSLWDRVGPMNSDDDNCITRYMVNNGWKTGWQNEPAALMTTNIGTSGGWAKFSGQLDRWARTTVRSNYSSLIEEKVIWKRHPWTAVFVMVAALFNYALVLDTGMSVLLWRAYGPLNDPVRRDSAIWMVRHAAQIGPLAVLWVALAITKLIKPASYYLRNPADLRYIPVQFAFGWYHSWVKFNSVITCRNARWGTRPGVD